MEKIPFEKLSESTKRQIEAVWESEYGPYATKNGPGTLTLQARVNREHKCVEVFTVGKWRRVHYYQGKSSPSSKIERECIQTVTLNMGLKKIQDGGPRIYLYWVEEEQKLEHLKSFSK